MTAPRLLRDHLRRAVFVRALLACAAAAAAALAGPGLGAIAALLAAGLVAWSIARLFAPLRAEVAELVEDAAGLRAEGERREVGEEADVSELAARLDETREDLEQALRDARVERDDLLSILEATSEGVLVLGRDSRVELVNGVARRILRPPVDPLGRSIHEVARQPELLELAEALRSGEAQPPIRIDAADTGGARSFMVSGEVATGAGLRGRVVLVLRDLTDVQRLERVRSDFVANVTHEMRSPLASILGYAETLAEDGEIESETGRDCLERILRNARRLDDIIRDLIDLSRLEHATAPSIGSCDPRELLRRTAGDFRDRAAAKGIEIAVDAARLPAAVELDEGLVRQALVNLVDNAVKYTPAGGRVSLSGELASEPASGRSRLDVSVSDTGPGIPPEHQSRIFERFYRVDTARSRALGGTGLGLAIAKHAAALHGGRVRLESRIGAGSTFRLELPLPRAVGAGSAPEPDAGERRGEAGRGSPPGSP